MGTLSHLKSVLVVEDDYLISMDLIMMLEKLGCEHVKAAHSCAGGLDLVAATEFDLVTVDIRLQDGTCHELVDVLQGRKIPFVYVTGCDAADTPPVKAPRVLKPMSHELLLQAALEVTSGTQVSSSA